MRHPLKRAREGDHHGISSIRRMGILMENATLYKTSPMQLMAAVGLAFALLTSQAQAQTCPAPASGYLFNLSLRVEGDVASVGTSAYLLSHWSLAPAVGYGIAGSQDLGSLGQILSGSLNSDPLLYDNGKYRIGMGNMVGYSLTLPIPASSATISIATTMMSLGSASARPAPRISGSRIDPATPSGSAASI